MQSDRMQIGVCDDNMGIADGWVNEIRNVAPTDFDVDSIKGAKEEVSTLLKRKLAVKDKKNPLDLPTTFDGLDILVVDYDLLHLDNDGSRTTGEGIARLARSYSKCGAIVVMNQFKGPQFDLGMRGHLDSHADINVDAELIGCRALWEDILPAEREFKPTTWTLLPDLLAAARDLAEKLSSEGMDAAIMPILGLKEDALAELSDTAFGFLSSEAETANDLASVTVRKFLDRSLNASIVEYLSNHAAELLFNFAAFRIVKWLDRAVLRPMDVLIDTVHLVDRLPFVINVDKTDVSNSVAWAEAAAKPSERLCWDVLERFHNQPASKALGRAVFDWYKITLDDEIDEMQDKYLEKQPTRFHLAEDTSRFVGKDALTRYRADFHNFGDRRAIEKLGGISYGPLRRISFG